MFSALNSDKYPNFSPKINLRSVAHRPPELEEGVRLAKEVLLVQAATVDREVGGFLLALVDLFGANCRNEAFGGDMPLKVDSSTAKPHNIAPLSLFGFAT